MQPQEHDEFQRFDSVVGFPPHYRIFGDFDVEIATLSPTQAKQLLLWLRDHEEQIEKDMLLEQAWRKQREEWK